MNSQILAKIKKTDRRKQGVVIGLVALVAIIIVVLITQLSQPQRSAAAYCKVYGQEKARLSTMSNASDPYPSGVFNVSVNDAGQVATSLSKLDSVAPTTIEPDVSNLQKLYEDIHNNPSHAVGDSLNGGSTDDSLKAWTQQHCGN